MTGEDMKRWVESAASDSRRGQVITIPIILDPALPPDGWYLKADFIECGHE